MPYSIRSAGHIREMGYCRSPGPGAYVPGLFCDGDIMATRRRRFKKSENQICPISYQKCDNPAGASLKTCYYCGRYDEKQMQEALGKESDTRPRYDESAILNAKPFVEQPQKGQRTANP